MSLNHIFLPRTLFWSLPKVEIFAPEHEYDNEPFLGYLRRILWTVNDIIDIKSSQKSREQVHGILQTWTYFGILYDFTGRSVKIHELSDEVDGRLFLSTRPLTGILEQWINRESTSTLTQWSARVEHMSKCYKILSGIYDTIYLRDSEFLDHGFYLSVQLLYEYLIRAATIIGSRISAATPPVRYKELLGSRFVVQEKMKALGWCPSSIHMLWETLTVTEFTFASLLDKPGQGKRHSNCTKHKCHAYQITKTSDYVTKHTKDDCRCESVFASQEKLANVLLKRKASVPLVCPSEPKRGIDGRLYVDVADSQMLHDQKTVKVQYVAVSHVWSDGLGNNDENAIPWCQFERLRGLVASACAGDGSGERRAYPFWLDTLCFPLQPKKAYDMALIRMRKSYEDAHKVLVLDSYLLAGDDTSSTLEELAIRILCSPWNRRLWTLQEAVLARSLVFQFRNRSLDLGAWAQGGSGHPTTLQSLVFTGAWRFISSLRVFETEESRTMNIVQAKRALIYRSTSVADDEPLCLGNLLGIDPDKVVHAGSRVERMKLIWKSLPKHFSSTIFWDTSRFNDDRLRWASTSLMDDAGGCGRVETCFEDGCWDPSDGLVVTLPGVLLSHSNLDNWSSFSFTCDVKGSFLVQRFERKDLNAMQEVPYQVTKPMQDRKFAILLTKPLEDSEEPTDVAFFAQLCEVIQMESSRIHVNLLSRIRVFRTEHLKHRPHAGLSQVEAALQQLTLHQSMTSKPDGSMERESEGYDELEVAEGTYLQEMMWCVK